MNAILLAVFSALTQMPANNMDMLAAYSGVWKVETTHFDTKFSKAAKESATLRNDCWRSENFFACHQFLDGKPAAFIVYTHNTKSNLYHSYILPSGGGPAATGTLSIQGNVWTFPWEQKDDAGKIVQYRVVNVWKGTGAIDYRTEFSEDGAHWTATASGHETKLPQNPH